MSTSSIRPGYGDVALDQDDAARAVALRMSDYWWLFLVAGTAWIIVSLVILQFNDASITTIGLITGAMFIASGFQQIALGFLGESLRVVYTLFGVLFLIAGLICFFNPADTFAGLADVLAFLFLTVGIWWTIRAFLVKPADSTWWVGLIAGFLMIVTAFWTSGQFFIQKAYILLVFAGVWALMHGITDIFRAFALKRVRDDVAVQR
jgi:uncharacterized membrane protein HdeD (DUF308 family)